MIYILAISNLGCFAKHSAAAAGNTSTQEDMSVTWPFHLSNPGSSCNTKRLHHQPHQTCSLCWDKAHRDHNLVEVSNLHANHRLPCASEQRTCNASHLRAYLCTVDAIATVASLLKTSRGSAPPSPYKSVCTTPVVTAHRTIVLRV